MSNSAHRASFTFTALLCFPDREKSAPEAAQSHGIKKIGLALLRDRTVTGWNLVRGVAAPDQCD